jgi:small multidrug resistance pump
MLRFDLALVYKKPQAVGMELLTVTDRSPRWMTTVLLIAAVYNVLWGAWTVLLPHQLFDWCGIIRPNYPQLWQCIGMIVGVYGVGYALAARDPYRHWPIVVVGLMGKLFGPMGFAMALYQGVFPPVFGLTILSNDLIWWIPFSTILFKAWQYYRTPT